MIKYLPASDSLVLTVDDMEKIWEARKKLLEAEFETRRRKDVDAVTLFSGITSTTGRTDADTQPTKRQLADLQEPARKVRWK